MTGVVSETVTGTPPRQPSSTPTVPLNVGATHAYDEPFPFDLNEEPYCHRLDVAGSLVDGPLPQVVRRWADVYSWVADPSALYFRAQAARGAQLVTGPEAGA